MSHDWVQLVKFSDTLKSIIQTIIDVTPEGSTVDVSKLRTGLNELQTTEEDLRDGREQYDGVLKIFEQVVMVVGILVVICAVKSGLGLVSRVRVTTLDISISRTACCLAWPRSRQQLAEQHAS